MNENGDMEPREPEQGENFRSEPLEEMVETSSTAHRSGPLDIHPAFPFRLSLLTYITLIILALWPLSNLFSSADPVEMIELLGAAPLFFYLTTILFLWLIFGLVWLTSWRENEGLAGLGFTRLRPLHFLQALTFFLVSALILKGLEMALAALGYPTLGALELLLPNTGWERFWWVILSASAGICEEAAFRGYLLTRAWKLAPQTWSSSARWIPGIVISALLFGLGHTYQGVAGFTMITVYGLMISGLFIYTRSLWPPVIAHFFLDFINIFVPLLDKSG